MGAGDFPPVSAPELQGMAPLPPQQGPPGPGMVPAGSPQYSGPPPGAGAPPAPVMLTEREIAQQAARYTHAGMLSAEQVISGDADRYLFLEPKLLEIVAWVQQALVQAERSDDIAKARTDPALRIEISEEIDRLALSYLLKERGIRGEEGKVLIAMVINEIVGLGPLEPLWQDPEITEVICNGPQSIFVERSGRLIRARGCRFRSQGHLLDVCQRILAPLNRKVDVRDPLADGRLPDGSRVNVAHHAIAPNGPLLTIRRFPAQNRTLADLVELKSMDEEMAALLATLVANKASTLVVGGTGSGKALDIETPIPTPSGFVKMGDLQVGDVVFDEEGNPTEVVGAYDIEHNKECFEVLFSDGSSIIADAEHLWRTQPQFPDSTQGYNVPGLQPLADSGAARVLWGIPGDAVLSRRDILEMFAGEQIEKDVRMAVAQLHPVGTGDSGEETFLARGVALSVMSSLCSDSRGPKRVDVLSERTLTTQQIRESLLNDSGEPNHFMPVIPSPIDYPARDLPVPPARLGAWLTSAPPDGAGHSENISAEMESYGMGSRRIPEKYLIASYDQRAALLSGIMSCSTAETDEYGPTERLECHEDLARDIQGLASSLGYVATVEAMEDSSQAVGETRASVTIRYLPRRDRQRERASRSIVAVRAVPTRPVRCIRVANESHMFLAGKAYVPTHNTTLLNALSAAIPRHERVITIEDSLELRLHPESHVAAMEARPADATGSNAIAIRHLVKNALRMRPDRIIVGEIRDSAALDMLQACNTGHEGSMSTVHANGPDEAISRLTVMVAQGGEIPAAKVEWLIGSALDLMVIAKRYDDGSRRVAGLYEVPDVTNLAPGESLRTIPLWTWEQTGIDSKGKAIGRYVKRNEISDHLRRERNLNHGKTYTWEDVVALSADKSPGAQAAPPGAPQKPVPPRPSVSRAR